MTAQPSLPFPEPRDLETEFRRFHAENPNVYALVCRVCDELLSRGVERYGIAGVWERARWHVRVETNDPTYKLDNSYRSRYARLWLADHPDRPDFFETRTLRSSPGVGRFGRGAAR